MGSAPNADFVTAEFPKQPQRGPGNSRPAWHTEGPKAADEGQGVSGKGQISGGTFAPFAASKCRSGQLDCG